MRSLRQRGSAPAQERGAWGGGQNSSPRSLAPELGHTIIVLRRLSEKLHLGQPLCNRSVQIHYLTTQNCFVKKQRYVRRLWLASVRADILPLSLVLSLAFLALQAPPSCFSAPLWVRSSPGQKEPHLGMMAHVFFLPSTFAVAPGLGSWLTRQSFSGSGLRWIRGLSCGLSRACGPSRHQHEGYLEAPKDGPALKNFLKGHLTALPSLCLKPCIFQSWFLG